jgi:hypothetical protein
LVVLGRDSLDTLEKWVRDRFEAVPIRTKPGEERIVYSSDVIAEDQMGVSKRVVPSPGSVDLTYEATPYSPSSSLIRSRICASWRSPSHSLIKSTSTCRR